MAVKHSYRSTMYCQLRPDSPPLLQCFWSGLEADYAEKFNDNIPEGVGGVRRKGQWIDSQMKGAAGQTGANDKSLASRMPRLTCMFQ